MAYCCSPLAVQVYSARGAQVGWVWSSPYVLKVKFFPFFPFIFQAWSNLKQAIQRHNTLHGKAAMLTLRGELGLQDGTAARECEEGFLSIGISRPPSLPVASWASHRALPTVSAVTMAKSLHQWKTIGVLCTWHLTSQAKSISATDVGRWRFKWGSHWSTHRAFPRSELKPLREFFKRNWTGDFSKLLQIYPEVGDQSETLGPHWDSDRTNSPKIKRNQKRFCLQVSCAPEAPSSRKSPKTGEASQQLQ